MDLYFLRHTKTYQVQLCSITFPIVQSSNSHSESENHKNLSKVIEKVLEEFSLPQSRKCQKSQDAFSQTDNIPFHPAHCMGDGNSLFSSSYPQSMESQLDTKNMLPSVRSIPLEPMPLEIASLGGRDQILGDPKAPQCSPCQQFLSSNSDRVYQTCFPVPVDQQRIIICTVPALNEISDESVANIEATSPNNISHIKEVSSQYMLQEGKPLPSVSLQPVNGFTSSVMNVIQNEQYDGALNCAQCCKNISGFHTKLAGHEKRSEVVKKSPDTLSCDYSDSLENIPAPSTPISPQNIEPVFKKL